MNREAAGSKRETALWRYKRRKEQAKQHENGWNWRQHIPLLLTLISSVTILGRVAAAANFDRSTTLGILQSFGANSIILGAIYVALTGLLPYVYPMALLMDKVGWVGTQQTRITILRLAFVASIISILVAPLFLCLTAPFITALLYGSAKLIYWMEERHSPASGDMARELRNILALQISAMIITGVLVQSTPWVPAERIVVGGQAPRTGYVLSSAPTVTAILWHEPRELAYLPTKDVSARTLCKHSGGWSEVLSVTFIDLIDSDDPEYVKCPK